MAQALTRCGDFKTTYRADTTIFPSARSRAFALLGIAILIAGAAADRRLQRAQRLLGHPVHPDRLSRHRRPRPQHPGRIYRADLARPLGLLRLRRFRLGLSEQHLRHSGILQYPAGGAVDHRRGSDRRHPRRADQGPLPRHRDSRPRSSSCRTSSPAPTGSPAAPPARWQRPSLSSATRSAATGSTSMSCSPTSW